MSDSLAARAVGVLTAASPADKVGLARATAQAWREGGLGIGHADPPRRPARPALRHPREPEVKAGREAAGLSPRFYAPLAG
ncbi:MAG: hypothetical protein ACE5LF_07760 [Alphaproteobacteria bacterium]